MRGCELENSTMKKANIESGNAAGKKAYELGLVPIYECLSRLNPVGALDMIDRIICTTAHEFGRWSQIARIPKGCTPVDDSTLFHVWEASICEVYPNSSESKIDHVIGFLRRLIEGAWSHYVSPIDTPLQKEKERNDACVAFFHFAIGLILDSKEESRKEQWLKLRKLGESVPVAFDKALEISLRIGKPDAVLPLMGCMRGRTSNLLPVENFNDMVARHLFRAITLDRNRVAADFQSWTDILAPALEYQRPFPSGRHFDVLSPEEIMDECAAATQKVVHFANAVAELIKTFEEEKGGLFRFQVVNYDLSATTLEKLKFEVVASHDSIASLDKDEKIAFLRNAMQAKTVEVQSLCTRLGYHPRSIVINCQATF